MKNKSVILIIFFILSFGLTNNSCSKSEELETEKYNIEITKPIAISFCELAKNPEKYSGKTIYLKGVYMLRFEASSFFSLSCKAENQIVANFGAPPCNDKSELEQWDWSSPMLDRAHGIVVKGWFENKLITGHSTGDPPKYYRFKVDCIEKIKQLGTLVVNPKEEAEKVKNKIEQFEREKS